MRRVDGVLPSEVLSVKIPGGLDASGAPGFWQSLLPTGIPWYGTYGTYGTIPMYYHTILIAGDEIASG